MNETKELQLRQLKVLLEYMPKVRMIPNLIDRLENQGLNEMLPAQKDAIMRLVEKSYKKDEIVEKWSNNQPTSPIIKQVEQVQQVEHVDSYFESPLVKQVKERIPIGFKSPKIDPPKNHYTIDSAKGMSNAERFEQVFNF